MSFQTGPTAVQTSKLHIFKQNPFIFDKYETIERKGFGHPDTIADILAQKISRKYSNYTIEHCEGLILHHQIDKLMVIGGKTEVSFGNGKFIAPINIIVAGRASYSFNTTKIPVSKIITDTIHSHFSEYFPLVPQKMILIQNLLTNYAGPGTLKQSTGAISKMFNPDSKATVRGYEKYITNDTSMCISYAPLSPLEESILKVEKYLNNKSTKNQFPWLGSDIKMMAVRNNNEVSITTCIPQIAQYVKSLKDYQKNLETIGKIIDKMFSQLLPDYSVTILINTKDNYERMNIYLTVSGASLSGDIGVVGRGNRTNGLITSNRPMSMEGTNGKNPRYYAGFIYANVTQKIANRIYEKTNKPCIVEIVSQNGGMLKKPWKIRIVTLADSKTVKQIVSNELDYIKNVTLDFLSNEVENC